MSGVEETCLRSVLGVWGGLRNKMKFEIPHTHTTQGFKRESQNMTLGTEKRCLANKDNEFADTAAWILDKTKANKALANVMHWFRTKGTNKKIHCLLTSLMIVWVFTVNCDFISLKKKNVSVTLRSLRVIKENVSDHISVTVKNKT